MTTGGSNPTSGNRSRSSSQPPTSYQNNSSIALSERPDFHDEQEPSLITATCSTRSISLIFFSRFLRMILYGATGVIFLLFLTDSQEFKFTTVETTAALALVYVGDWAISLFLTSRADRYGRRLVLVVASLLLAGLGLCFYFVSNNIAVVITIGFFGIVSPSGNELGPFVAIEQSALADILTHFFSTYYPTAHSVAHQRMKKEVLPASLTTLISWYQLFGSLSQAGGALGVGFVSHYLMDKRGFSPASAYQHLFLGYSVAGGVLCLVYLMLGSDVEMSEEDLAKREEDKKKARQDRENTAVAASTSTARNDNDRNYASIASAQAQDIGGINEQQRQEEQRQKDEGPCCCSGPLHALGIFRPKTQSNVLLFAALFFWDAFAGGLIIQSYISWYFHKRWNMEVQHLGLLFMGINLLAALSGLFAGWLVKKIGAIRTMVFTHAPSNVFLALIVFMPNKDWAIALLLMRSLISQCDVPARQAFVVLVVPKDERSSSNGVTTSVRSLAVAFAAVALVPMLKAEQNSDKIFWNSVPFVAAGGLKLLYDFSVFVLFQRATGEVGKQGEKAPLIRTK